MLPMHTLRSEAVRYQALSEALKAEFLAIDQETLTDTLEGLTNLPEMLQAVVRSSLMDEALGEALRARIAEMRTRLERLENGYAAKRTLVCQIMEEAGLDRLLTEDFTVSRRPCQPKLEVVNESAVPQIYLVPQPPRLDRAGLLAALKAGQDVAGARLQIGGYHIQVRTK